MLVTYVRDFEGVPFGVVVAVDREKIGVSCCNPKDKFVKKVGIKIARQRAESSADLDRFYPESDKLVFQQYIMDMRTRARKYFKLAVPTEQAYS